MTWKSQHSEEKDCDFDDNPATSTECDGAAPTFLETFHALLEKEAKSDLVSQQRKQDLTGGDFASLDFEESLDMVLAMFE
jgi:hypothetical protein